MHFVCNLNAHEMHFGAPNGHLNAFVCQSDSETNAFWGQSECSRNALLYLLASPTDHLNAFACQSDSETNAFRVQSNAHEIHFGARSESLLASLVPA